MQMDRAGGFARLTQVGNHPHIFPAGIEQHLAARRNGMDLNLQAGIHRQGRAEKAGQGKAG